MLIDGDYWDCRLLLDGRAVELGKWYDFGVTFLSPQSVLPLLSKGKTFKLWHGREVAEGSVVDLPS